MIFVQIAIFEFIFTLVLESDNNETDENIDHEKADDDDISDVEDRDERFVVVDGTAVFFAGVDGHPQQVGPT